MSKQKKKIACKNSLQKKISQTIEVLDNGASIEKLNLTDADGPIMKGKRATSIPITMPRQLAAKRTPNHFYCDVTTEGNDKAQLVPVSRRIQENTAQEVKIALADADYGTLTALNIWMKMAFVDVPYRT